MTRTPDRLFIRRSFLGGALALAGGPALAAGRRPVVTVLGDSITAGLGLPAAQALPARLQAALARIGPQALVRGAGVSGDTISAGLERIDFSVQADTDLCLVALGGNDLLQGLDPRAAKADLDRIVRRLQARHIGVMLAGVAAPPAVGRGYARDFAAVFASVAQACHVPLYPDLLAGVGTPLRQADGIHPSAAGVLIMAQRLAPLVARALKARR